MPAVQNKKLQPWRRGLPGLESYGVVYCYRGYPGQISQVQVSPGHILGGTVRDVLFESVRSGSGRS